MVRLSFIFFIALLLHSCALIGIFPRERLRIKRVDQSSTIEKLKLNVDGMYVYEEASSEYFFRSFFYLFRNGVCYISGYSAYNDQHKKNAEDIYINQKTLHQDAPLKWGVYNIEKDSIYMEYWRIDSGDFIYTRASWKGRIIDGNTIRMEKRRSRVDTLFHFLPLKNKPDSTNRFIK